MNKQELVEPDPPHVREDYREVWLSGWRAAAAAADARSLPPLNCPVHGRDAEGRCCTGCVTDHAKATEAERDRLRYALVKVRGHTAYLPEAPYTLLAGLLQNIERITDAALSGGDSPKEDERR